MTRHDPRTGRFTTAERITTTVTERVTVEPPRTPGPPPQVTGRPLHLYGFAHLLSHPPDQRWAHPAFIADEAARAAAAGQRPAEPVTVPAPDAAPMPVIMVPRVPYPQLEPATLAHEFTDADRERLAWTLSDGEYLP
jgi:hypothetical protein